MNENKISPAMRFVMSLFGLHNEPGRSLRNPLGTTAYNNKIIGHKKNY